ncbi:hypothetical protein JIY74_31270 [Vibrio harveyi]|nr:hypothetical protein [Vibrio harveyi]
MSNSAFRFKIEALSVALVNLPAADLALVLLVFRVDNLFSFINPIAAPTFEPWNMLLAAFLAIIFPVAPTRPSQPPPMAAPFARPSPVFATFPTNPPVLFETSDIFPPFVGDKVDFSLPNKRFFENPPIVASPEASFPLNDFSKGEETPSPDPNSFKIQSTIGVTFSDRAANTNNIRTLIASGGNSD